MNQLLGVSKRPNPYYFSKYSQTEFEHSIMAKELFQMLEIYFQDSSSKNNKKKAGHAKSHICLRLTGRTGSL